MQFAAQLAPHLLDPRGRSGRADFLRVAITLFVLQLTFLAGLWRLNSDTDHVALLPVNLVFCWMAYAAVSRRLHDLDRSAWWLPAAAGMWIVVGFLVALGVALVAGSDVVKPGRPGFWAVFLCLLASPFAVALWLHLAAGTGQPNRYGPPGDDCELGLRIA